jgi:hypothetical protein
MEDNRSKQIEESDDELVKLIRFHVEDILDKYYLKQGLKADFDIRDDTILYVFEIARKKGTYNTKFQNNKDKYIRIIAKNYIFGINLENPK